MHLFNKWAKKRKKEIPDDLKSDRELDQYEIMHLNDLKRWIYKRQIKHQAEKNKEIKAKVVQKEQPNLMGYVRKVA